MFVNRNLICFKYDIRYLGCRINLLNVPLNIKEIFLDVRMNMLLDLHDMVKLIIFTTVVYIMIECVEY
jgi:hypothetical protein